MPPPTLHTPIGTKSNIEQGKEKHGGAFVVNLARWKMLVNDARMHLYVCFIRNARLGMRVTYHFVWRVLLDANFFGNFAALHALCIVAALAAMLPSECATKSHYVFSLLLDNIRA